MFSRFFNASLQTVSNAASFITFRASQNARTLGNNIRGSAIVNQVANKWEDFLYEGSQGYHTYAQRAADQEARAKLTALLDDFFALKARPYCEENKKTLLERSKLICETLPHIIGEINVDAIGQNLATCGSNATTYAPHKLKNIFEIQYNHFRYDEGANVVIPAAKEALHNAAKKNYPRASANAQKIASLTEDSKAILSHQTISYYYNELQTHARLIKWCLEDYQDYIKSLQHISNSTVNNGEELVKALQRAKGAATALVEKCDQTPLEITIDELKACWTECNKLYDNARSLCKQEKEKREKAANEADISSKTAHFTQQLKLATELLEGREMKDYKYDKEVANSYHRGNTEPFAKKIQLKRTNAETLLNEVLESAGNNPAYSYYRSKAVELLTKHRFGDYDSGTYQPYSSWSRIINPGY